MSAAAALQKWLELKNKTFTPIFSDTTILGETKMDVSREQVSNERIMDFLFFFCFIFLSEYWFFCLIGTLATNTLKPRNLVHQLPMLCFTPGSTVPHQVNTKLFNFPIIYIIYY